MASNTLVADRRKKMVRHAPMALQINQQAFKISGYKHHLSYGVWTFSALSIVLLSMRAPSELWLTIVSVTTLLGGLYWRWTYLSNHIRDASVPEFLIAHPTDFAWLEWARDLEPHIDALLKRIRPDRQYTSRDFQKAYALHTYYWIDVPKRAPYYGDTERCFDDLERRREPQRAEMAQHANAKD